MIDKAARLDHEIDTAEQQLKKQYGSKRDDYYGLVFFESVLRVSRVAALDRIAFGSHDLGIDGVYFDPDQGGFRIFQFKNSRNISLFQQSFETLIEKGVPALFGDYVAVPDHQQIIDVCRKELTACKEQVSQVYIDFVFRGAPQDAEASAAISNLKERLEEKAWILERYFGDPVPLLVRFFQFDGLTPPSPTTERFKVRFTDIVEHSGPGGLKMYAGYIPLADLYGMHATLGRRFLERNIRYMLPPKSAVNKSLRDVFAETLLKRTVPPELFAFHHNGVALSAGSLETEGGHTIIRAPRLLNGAQTVSTFSEFWESNGLALETTGGKDLVEKLVLLARIIVHGSPESITEITISNNRQNPVLPWQLHANDPIQFKLEDYFKSCGIPYQRQDRAFAKVTAEELEDYKETRAIELLRLAKTYLAAEGELRKLTHLGNVFENQKDYRELFGDHRLNADPRKVILCYKSQFHLSRIVQEIKEKGTQRYEFVNRAKEMVWALLCQAILNDPELESMAEEFGGDLARPHKYNEKLRELASTRVRFAIAALISDPEYAERAKDGNYVFMRSSEAFLKAMMFAKKRWDWRTVPLR